MGKFVRTRSSDPVEVSTFEVNDEGLAIIDFVVPNVPAGEHHLELRGGDGSVYRMPILVTETPVTDAPAALRIGGLMRLGGEPGLLVSLRLVVAGTENG